MLCKSVLFNATLTVPREIHFHASDKLIIKWLSRSMTNVSLAAHILLLFHSPELQTMKNNEEIFLILYLAQCDNWYVT